MVSYVVFFDIFEVLKYLYAVANKRGIIINTPIPAKAIIVLFRMGPKIKGLLPNRTALALENPYCEISVPNNGKSAS